MLFFIRSVRLEAQFRLRSNQKPTLIFNIIQSLLPEASEWSNSSAWANQNTRNLAVFWHTERWSPETQNTSFESIKSSRKLLPSVDIFEKCINALPSDKARHCITFFQAVEPGGTHSMVYGTLSIYPE